MQYNAEPGRLAAVYGGVVVGSLLAALWTHYIDPIINKDGILYVLTATAFANGNFAEALAAYKWPFYPFLLAAISKVIPLSVESLALLLGAVMRALGGVAFIKLGKQLGADKTQLWLAAGIYVFYPGLNEIQSMIMRDVAYIACFLWMVVFFVQYSTRPNSRDLIACVLTGVLAMAFRVEGMVYLGGILFWVLISGRYTPAWLTRKLAVVAALGLLALFAYVTLYWLYGGSMEVAGRWLQRIWLPPKNELSGYIQSLDPGGMRAALEMAFYPAVALLPFAKAIFNFAEVLTVGYVLILIAGWFARPWMDRQAPAYQQTMQCWKLVVAINILILIVFALLRFLYNDRYPLSLSVMAMLLVPFAITALCRHKAGRTRLKTGVICVLTGLLLLLNSLEGLDRFTAKYHLREAGTWIRQQVGDDYHQYRIYSNRRILDYYAGQDVFQPYPYYLRSLPNPEALPEKFDFLAICFDRTGRKAHYYENLVSALGMAPDRIFENHKGDRALIYDFRKKEP